jgi:GLPGLI family protein
MNYRITCNTMCLLFALTLAVNAFGQGAYWESKVEGGPMNGQTDMMYYMPKMFKMVSSGRDNTMIFRLDKDLVYIVNPKEKTYSEITFAQMEAMMKKGKSKLDARMAEMRKKMESMPEEQRKMMEKMMGSKMAGMNKDVKIDVTATGEHKPISGYACTKYVATQDGEEIMTFWTTKDAKEFASMRQDFESWASRMAALNPMAGKGYQEAFMKLQGFPIETDMGDIKNVVTKIEKRSTPLSEFEVPAGYTKVKSDFEKGMEKMDEEKE